MEPDADLASLMALLQSITTEFISIQCCADSNFTDPNTTISYISDGSWYPDKQTCQNTIWTGHENPESTEARFFSSEYESKWCYDLPTRIGIVYLIRGTFPLSNLQASSPDTFFNVSIGVTEIAKVNSIGESKVEGLFKAINNHTNFCLIKGKGEAYLSKVELRPLHPDYLKRDPSSLLKLIDRVYAGNKGDEIRYPFDQYDRIWRPYPYPYSTAKYITLPYANVNITDVNSLLPPLQALQTAITHPERLEFKYNNLDAGMYDYDLYFHFLELNDSVQAGQRVFEIYINDEKIQDVDIVASGSPYSVAVPNFTANGVLNLTFIKALNSQLGPICNAYEIFQAYTKDQETGVEEVDAITRVKNELLTHNKESQVLGTWSGDPCLPLPWHGVSCEPLNGTSVITKMNLSFSKLRGPLPPSVTRLTYLKELNLSNNGFMGTIPEFPATSMLTSLDLSHNDLTGNITDAIYAVASTENIVEKPISSISIQSFTLEYIEMATEKYKILIGEGGFGSVYRGTLPDGQEVAVKVRSATSTQGTREFDNELTFLSAIRHEHLVPLLGYCCENEQQILVYPFMSNGSLQDRLYGAAAKRKTLDWPTRISIALGAARGKDVKSSNILLDNSMSAKVADFGFSKYAPQEGDSGTSLEVRGTAGYLDPEGYISTLSPSLKELVPFRYYSTQHLSAKSDVFSFGVVLLEIVSGREPLNINRPRNEWSLVEWAKPHIRNSKIEEIVDPSIKGGYHAEALWRVVEVALACIEPYSAYRPCMVDIVRELEDAFIIENNASEYMKSMESFGGSFRYSIERPIVIPPTPIPIEASPILLQPPPPQPR
ncbi:hypothetical protein RD792_016629 [Penstemon davidsonii]|uniref:non-specific serine/threonine protein kinase n=1 Tax=Penstemon davidsonii TaxID=160366 RepID=A0ABR0CJV4_9LAMI|nr:hypothetical protein RD792_016629 [Penstemon davidsonii]